MSSLSSVSGKSEEGVGRLKEFLADDPVVCFAFLFGSYVKGTQKKTSDLDLAVYFHDPSPEGDRLLHLVSTLSNISAREIDLVVLNHASAFLRHQVMKYGASLIVKDRDVYRKFREKTISDYQEYKYVSGMNLYDR